MYISFSQKSCSEYISYISDVQHLYIGRVTSIYRTCSIYISNTTDI